MTDVEEASSRVAYIEAALSRLAHPGKDAENVRSRRQRAPPSATGPDPLEDRLRGLGRDDLERLCAAALRGDKPAAVLPPPRAAPAAAAEPAAVAANEDTGVLIEVGRLLAAARGDLARTLPPVMTALRRVTGAGHVSYFRVADGGDALECVASTDGGEARGSVVPCEGVIGFAVRSEGTVCVRDRTADWRYSGAADARPAAAAAEPLSALMVPVRDNDSRVVGVFDCAGPGALAEPSARAAANAAFVADAVGWCISRCGMEAEIEAGARHSEALQAIARVAASGEERSNVPRRVLQALGAVLSSSADALVYYEVVTPPPGHATEEEKHDQAAAGVWLVPHSLDRRVSPRAAAFPAAAVAAEVATTGRAVTLAAGPALAAATADDPVTLALRSAPASLTAVPVTDSHGHTLAVLEARGAAAASPRTAALVQSLAGAAESVLRQSLLLDEMVRRGRHAHALLRMNELMSAEMGTDNVVPLLIDAAYELVEAERITLFLVESSRYLEGAPANGGGGGGGGNGGSRDGMPRSRPVRSRRATSAADERDERRRRAMSARDITRSLSRSSVIRGQDDAEVAAPPPPPQSPPPPSSPPPPHLPQSPSAADRHSPALPSGGGLELVCRVSRDAEFEGTRIPWGSGIVGTVAMTNRALNIPDAYLDSRFDPASDRRTSFRTRAILTMPVSDERGRVVAVIQAVNKASPAAGPGGAAFNVADEAGLASLASSAGIILRKTQLYQDVRAAQRRTNALLRLVQVSSAPHKALRSVVDGMVDVAHDVLGAERVRLYFAHHNELFAVSTRGSGAGVPPPRVPFGEGIAGTVAVTGEPVMLAHASDHRAFRPDLEAVPGGFRAASVLCLPVRDAGGRVLAVIQAFNKLLPDAATAAAAAAVTSRGTAAAPPSPPASPARRRHAGRLGTLSAVASRRAAASRLGAAAPSGSERYLPFTREDLSVMVAFCAQMRATVRRYRPDALLEHAGGDTVRGVAEGRVAGAAAGPGAAGGRRGSVSVTVSGPSAAAAAAAAAEGAAPSAYALPALPRAVDAAEAALAWAALPPPAQVRDTLRSSFMAELDFDVWEYSDDELTALTVAVFEELGLVRDFGIDLRSLQTFVLSVRHAYRDVPFHCWKHGFSVMHAAFWMLRATRLGDDLAEPADRLALILAALCHDVDHPGTTNSFLINTQSPLALVHNDHSVLENHHAYCATTLLAQHPGVLQGLDAAGRAALRGAMIEAILATDMSVHFEATAKLGDREPGSAFEPRDAVNAAIHTADLSGQVFPLQVAARWEERISAELQRQAEREEELGLPVAPFMQGLDCARRRAVNQVNFIDFVLAPWFSEMARLFPGMRGCHEQLMSNRAHFEQVGRGGDE